MDCKYCNTANPDEAVYCMNCGRRLDGMAICSACGKKTPGEGSYCIFCGTPVAAYPRAAFVHPAAAKPAAAKTAQPASGWKRVLLLVGGACAMAAVFFSFLFVFFLGCSAAGSLDAGSSSTALVSDSPSLFYYFGEAYADLEDALAQLTSYSGYYATSMYLCTVFGTVISAAVLVSVTVFTILAVVRYIQQMFGKSGKSAGPCAFGAYFSYAAGAVLYTALHAVKISVDGSGTSASASIVYNGATLAGIILGAIFLAAYAVLCAIARGKFRAAYLAHNILTLAAILFCAAAMGLLALPSVQLTIAEAGARGTFGLGLIIALATCGAAGISIMEWDQLPAGYTETMIYSVIGFVVLIALTIMCALLLARLCADISEDRKRKASASSVVLAAMTTVLAVLFAVFSALVAETLIETGVMGAEFEPTYLVVIFVCILAALGMGVIIARAAATRNEAQPQLTYAYPVTTVYAVPANTAGTENAPAPAAQPTAPEEGGDV